MNKIDVEVGRIYRRDGETWLGAIFNWSGTKVQVTGLQISAEFFGNNGSSQYTEYAYEPNVSDIIVAQGEGIINIPVSQIFAEYSDFGIYKVLVYWYDTEEQENGFDEWLVSDVEFAYHCISSQLLKMGDQCTELSDNVIQSYLLLFGHHQAMNYKEIQKAKLFYKKLLQLCKGKCYTINPCNCQ